jgi:hypothetical protein
MSEQDEHRERLRRLGTVAREVWEETQDWEAVANSMWHHAHNELVPSLPSVNLSSGSGS